MKMGSDRAAGHGLSFIQTPHSRSLAGTHGKHVCREWERVGSAESPVGMNEASSSKPMTGSMERSGWRR